MPSLINNGGNITDVAANYRQQIVPFSSFGTRKVAWFRVAFVDTSNSGSLDMVNFNNIISAIQTQAEIVMVGAPRMDDNTGKFMIAVFADTMNDGAQTTQANEGQVGFNPNGSTLQDVVRAATGDSDAEVSRWYLFGAPVTPFNDNVALGWSTNTQYQEYETKAEFLGGYTQD